MELQIALDRLQSEQSLVVKNFTFEPDTIDHAILDTGESVFWIRNQSGRWLSIDVNSDEVILFEETDEDIEPDDELVSFRNRDFEFSYEGNGKLVDEDGVELEVIIFKDYEGDGEILRIIESDVTGDRMVSIGKIVADDEISEA